MDFIELLVPRFFFLIFLKQNPCVCTLSIRHLNLKGITDLKHIEGI